MTKHRYALGAFLAAACVTVPAHAGVLVVGGDATIGPRFGTAVSAGTAALQGNKAFQTNLLGGGNSVAVFRYSAVNSYPNPPLGDQLASTYTSLGYSASVFDTAVSASVLAGADLLVILARSNAFTAGETSAIRDFLFAGGNVLLTGEANNIGTSANNSLNGLLTGLGSSIRLNNVAQDPGDRFATGAEIVADPLTAGVTSFGYGYTTTVTGGRTLFYNDSGNAFMAAENFMVAVPEPSTWALLILGFGAVGLGMRRQRMQVRAATASA